MIKHSTEKVTKDLPASPIYSYVRKAGTSVCAL